MRGARNQRFNKNSDGFHHTFHNYTTDGLDIESRGGEYSNTSHTRAIGFRELLISLFVDGDEFLLHIFADGLDLVAPCVADKERFEFYSLF